MRAPPNLSSLLLVATCLILLTIQVQITVSAVKTKSNYIIHMDKSHMPEPFISHHHWYTSLLDSLTTDQQSYSLPPSVIYTYNTVFNGFSATLTPDELESLKNSPGFVSAFPDRTPELDTTHTPEFLDLRPSAGIWPASNFGEDIIIGVVDSGVWPESESFNDRGMSPNIPTKWKGTCQVGPDFNSSMCNRKLIGAQYFNKGLIAEGGPDVHLVGKSPRDTNGHGTHTASTAAGSHVHNVSFFGYAGGTARGIAPRARLAVYKVSWHQGSSEADMLAGIDKAVEDGVDVLSISLNLGRVEFYRDSLAIASFAAVERGVLVSLVAGNRGPNFATVRNSGPWVVTVAAGTVDRSFGGTLRLGNGVSIRGWSLFPAGAIVENRGLLYNRTLAVCNSSDLLREAGSFGNTIIVCDSTLPELEDAIGNTDLQIHFITEAQVVGAIFISKQQEIYESRHFPCPAVVISPKDGKAVIKYAQRTENPSASIKFQETFVGTKPAPAVARFSSRGFPIHPFILKPDIMAPGTLILAATVPNREAVKIGQNVGLPSEYSLLSGTSMSTPHIAGVAALLKSVHPEWSPTAIKSAMMTTADPLDNTRNPIIDNGDEFRPASALAGSGHVDPNRALDPGLVYDATPQDYLNFLCALNFTNEELMTITRSKANDCSKASLDINYPAFVGFCENLNVSEVFKFKRVVTNVGNGPSKYNVLVKSPKDSVVLVSPKTLVFKKKNEKKSYTVTVTCKRWSSNGNRDGDIVWVEEKGKHRVRSPIVFSFFSSSLN